MDAKVSTSSNGFWNLCRSSSYSIYIYQTIFLYYFLLFLFLSGRGEYARVHRMYHAPSKSQFAVKRLPFEVETSDRSRILNDWNVSMRTSTCPYAVLSYGALSVGCEFWVVMELMDDSLDKFLQKVRPTINASFKFKWLENYVVTLRLSMFITFYGSVIDIYKFCLWKVKIYLELGLCLCIFVLKTFEIFELDFSFECCQMKICKFFKEKILHRLVFSYLARTWQTTSNLLDSVNLTPGSTLVLRVGWWRLSYLHSYGWLVS